jgi:hypothetical protein
MSSEMEHRSRNEQKFITDFFFGKMKKELCGADIVTAFILHYFFIIIVRYV